MVLHNSANVGFWRSSVNAALQEALTIGNNSDLTIRTAIEYTGLDLLQANEEPVFLIEALKRKQELDPADLVISVLDQSGEFVDAYGSEIYPGVPHLRFTPSNELGYPSEIQLQPGEALVYTSFQKTAVGTLALIPEIMPEVETIYLIAGGSDFGQGLLRFMQGVIESDGFPVEVKTLPASDRSELLRSAQSVPTNSALFMLAYEQDFEGHIYTTPDLISRISPAANAPIFAFYDSLAGRGIVGGRMTTAEATGRALGEMALEILAGQTPTVRGLETVAVFDDRQLERWNIDTALIPPGSRIDFEVASMWRSYRQQILWGIAIMLLQAALIAALMYSLKRRKLIERALIEKADDLSVQKDLFESVIDSVPDALLVSDTQGKIFAANEGAKAVFACETEALLGQSLANVINVPDPDKLLQSPSENADSQYFEPSTVSIRRNSSDEFTAEVIGTRILSSQGEVLGNIHLVRDVTHRLAREAESQQNQKMEALGALVGGISHDFNNVLGVISGYTELLHLGANEDKDREKLDKILKATRRGSALCKQVMTFSRDMSVEKKNLSLNDVVHDAIKLLSVSIPQEISITCEDDSSASKVLANFTQLEQLLINLVTNASQSMGDSSGKIEINVSQRHVSTSRALSRGTLEPGDYIELKISDSGSGMSPEVQQRIFEPFFTTKSEQNGQGMGMAIVYRIIKSHDAFVDLESVEGKGTTVFIYFPCSGSPETSAEETRERSAVQGKGQRILLVDDEEEILESMQQLLSNIGYQVDAYSDPQAALQRFTEAPDEYDLLISDHSMPTLTGSELTRAMRALRADLPAILCTGYSEMLDSNSQSDVRFDAVMQKPFSLIDISAAVQKTLGGYQTSGLSEGLTV